MKLDKAQERLAHKLQFDKRYWKDDGQECARMAAALLHWFNVSEVTAAELDLLKRVAIEGFRFWNCPACGELVCEGSDAVEEIDPDWSNFQGVCDNDRCSYPGYGYDDLRCNHCRCFNVGKNRLPDTAVTCDAGGADWDEYGY